MKKEAIKDLIPPFILRKLTGMFYGWYGDYPSWSEAVRKSRGYESPDILARVRDSSLKVKNGMAVYERDSLIFDHIEYSFPLLSGLLWIAGISGGKLNVLDYGGSLGSSYFQNKLFLDTIPEVNWCIVEQPEFFQTGTELFSGERLHFFTSIESCMCAYDINVVLLSSVLQYLEKPYDLLEKVISEHPEFIIIDRTPFVSGRDRITVQKVNPKIYHGSYPCWFFNEDKFISYLNKKYNLVLKFDALDKANIPSEFKGFIFQQIK